MQQQCWVHPEYKVKQLGPEALKSRNAQPGSTHGLHALFIATGYLSIALTVVIICLNARHSLVTELFDSGDKSFSISASVTTKNAFLDRITAPQRSYASNQVQYIADLIRRTSKKTSDGEKRLAKAIVVESIKANYDPLFVAAVIKSESTFNKHAVSNQGAQGLMQLLPKTGEYISRRARLGWQGNSKLREPEYNIRLGIAYLKYLEDKFDGNRERALIAYNWGPGNLGSALKNQRRVPSPPLKYARKILENHQSYTRELESRFANIRDLEQTSLFS